jgi:hypothetical protein
MVRAVHRFGMVIYIFIGLVAVVAGYGLMLCAGGVLLVQCARRLQDGYWTNFQFRLAWEFLGLTEEPLSAHGVEEIRRTLLDMPLSIGVFADGLVACVVGAFFMAQGEAERLEAEKLERE